MSLVFALILCVMLPLQREIQALRTVMLPKEVIKA